MQQMIEMCDDDAGAAMDIWNRFILDQRFIARQTKTYKTHKKLQTTMINHVGDDFVLMLSCFSKGHRKGKHAVVFAENIHWFRFDRFLIITKSIIY